MVSESHTWGGGGGGGGSRGCLSLDSLKFDVTIIMHNFSIRKLGVRLSKIIITIILLLILDGDISAKKTDEISKKRNVLRKFEL